MDEEGEGAVGGFYGGGGDAGLEVEDCVAVGMGGVSWCYVWGRIEGLDRTNLI